MTATGAGGSSRGLERRTVVQRLLSDRGGLLVVTGLGSSTWDAAAAGDDARNFYLWGAMGGAAAMGMGLALARPEHPVLVITGDGEQLMGLGALATIGARRPGNLAIVVLDNGLYGETGMQPSHTSCGTDLAGVAAACGFSWSARVEAMAEVEALRERIHRCDGPCLASVQIAADEPPRVLPVRDGVELKNRFRRALALAPN
ncbi:MAG: aldehyde dehydrogenase [Burkholderiales bacterium]|nr:MAG: aldehyde dehydrogenase [Burkholderiales bacterium]